MSDWNTMWDSLRGALGAQVPRVLGALLILVVGWFVAALVKAGARKALGLLGLQPWMLSPEAGHA